MVKLEGAHVSGSVILQPAVSVEIITEDPEPRDGLTIMGPSAEPVIGWNVVGASYVSKFKDVSAEISSLAMGQAVLSVDGTQMFVIERTSARLLYVYDLSIPGDLTSAVYSGDSVVLGGISHENPTGICFKDDGLAFFVTDIDTLNSVSWYSLSVPWDITSVLTVEGAVSLTTQGSNLRSVWVHPTLPKMWVLSQNNTKILQYTLGDPWSLTIAPTFDGSFDVSTWDSAPVGLFMKPEADKMYITGNTGDKVYQFNLSTPGDIVTTPPTFDAEFSTATQGDKPLGIFIDSTGFKMYIVDNTSRTVYQYALTGL